MVLGSNEEFECVIRLASFWYDTAGDEYARQHCNLVRTHKQFAARHACMGNVLRALRRRFEALRVWSVSVLVTAGFSA